MSKDDAGLKGGGIHFADREGPGRVASKARRGSDQG